MEGPVTVAQMRAFLADYPDDMEIEVFSGRMDSFTCWGISKQSDFDGFTGLVIWTEN